jgi:hypothetical protein
MFLRLLAAGTLALAASTVTLAGEKALMHCFAYPPIGAATQADWDAFYKASDAMPKKIPGVKRVWYGKLKAPLSLVMATDGADRKKVAAGEKDVTGKLGLVKREHGMCIEMKDADTLTSYAQHPYHKEWLAAYEKVRVAGTTTYDILGQ